LKELKVPEGRARIAQGFYPWGLRSAPLPSFVKSRRDDRSQAAGAGFARADTALAR